MRFIDFGVSQPRESLGPGMFAQFKFGTLLALYKMINSVLVNLESLNRDKVEGRQWKQGEFEEELKYVVMSLIARTQILIGGLDVTSSIILSVTGTGLVVAEGGGAAKQGVLTLASGRAISANTGITANSRVFLTAQTAITNPVFLIGKDAGVSFTIGSAYTGDSGDVAYEIFEVI